MQQDVFETELNRADMSRSKPRRSSRGPRIPHAHDYDIRGLVLDGIFIVAQDNKPVTYRAGDVFFVVAGTSHTEEIGPQGAKILVGRKY